MLEGMLTLENVAIVLGGLCGLVFLFSSIAIARGDQFITLERRWFGAQMADGRTVALRHEVGVQARTLGPGVHFLIPFIYKVSKHKFISIGTNQIGIVRAITGMPMPAGQFFAKTVPCNLFQDGEAFLKNGGEKGPQLAILPPGEYQINPELFATEITNAVLIDETEIGVVEAVAGQPCPVGRIFADPVECDAYQDADAFLHNGGQKGPQVKVLPPGSYRINTALFRVDKREQTVIPNGHVGLVTAMDGARIAEGNLLGRKIEGHSNFEDGNGFLRNGGQKGHQLDVLMPGTYRINTSLFVISAVVPWTHIGADSVGIVTVLEGRPISDAAKIAADEISLEIHNNFQNPAAFLAAGGQKGLQIPVLRSGNYAINPWFASIDQVPMVEVKIGECAVVTSFVGEEGEDTTSADVNAKIVRNGKRGIWAEPLGPGKHPINTKVCKVDKVLTTQILLNWADNESSAHKLDSNLKTITLRTADAFNVSMDVSVIIHIAMADAPKVVANLGSVDNLISQVLEPAISSHFRNAAQSVKALDLYTKRAELQSRAKEHIQAVLRIHHIESKDTMIADVVLPPELTRTVTDRQIAEQERMTFATQKQAQEERKLLENAKAQANMQPKVVESERGVEIAKNLANAEIEKSTGDARANEIRAEGSSKATKLAAGATAEATRVNAIADAEAIEKKGLAEARVIMEQGKSTAESYKLQVNAMGNDVFGQIQVVEKIAASHLKLIPDVYVGGGGGGGADQNPLMSLALLQYLTGKSAFTREQTGTPPASP
ncbi:MAG TPA: SPFH domain-containing protein [Polyangiaceae bacterium]|nr:SPFH domain-containing protein [Polyangiaceae bacterium]